MRSNMYYWLSANPLVLRYWELPEVDIGEFMPDTRLYRLALYWWHITANAVEQYQVRAQELRPHHRFFHLVNDQWLWLELQARGIPAIHCSQNAFLDERIFDVDTTATKRFDAAYNARMSPFKRHELARDIKSLYIIGGLPTPYDTLEYFEGVRQTLSHAEFSNYPNLDVMFDAPGIATQIRQARVGLCLSAREGAMFAAVEYLLCGLPVVSTLSEGGRDEWFDSRYVRIVPDHPAAVAQAVQDLIRLDLDPHFIRQETLKKVWPHRRRFINLVQDIYDAEAASRDFAREFYPRFINKICDWRPVDQVMSYVDKDCGSLS